MRGTEWAFRPWRACVEQCDPSRAGLCTAILALVRLVLAGSRIIIVFSPLTSLNPPSLAWVARGEPVLQMWQG